MYSFHRLQLLDYLEILFFAIILNLNAIRIMILSSEILTYLVFVAFCFIIFVNEFIFYKKQYICLKDVLVILMVSFIYIGFTSFGNENALPQMFKFLSCIIVANLSASLDDKKRSLGLQLSVIISTIYSIYLIQNMKAIYSLVSSRVFNYLDITLSLGLGMSFLLSSLFLGKIWKRSKISLAIVSFSIFVHALSLLQLYARGNLIFPIVVVITILLYKNKINIKKLIMSGFVVLVVLAISYYVISRFANERLLKRLMGLFTNNIFQEDRIQIYRFYIDYILHNLRCITGIGFKASAEVLQKARFTVSYPHNFILELIGELGIIGFTLIFIITLRVIKGINKQIAQFENSNMDVSKSATLFYATFAGLLFYTFSYLKSYSIYDGYQLYIFISWIMHDPKNKTINQKILD